MGDKIEKAKEALETAKNAMDKAQNLADNATNLMGNAQNIADKATSLISGVRIILISLAVLAAAGILYWMYNSTSLSLNQERTTVTATQVESFKEIGQWEFLTVIGEEIVDTVYVEETTTLGISMTSRNQLARIYTGTLRFGFDLKEDTKDMPDWIKVTADTIIDVTLPKVHLLDENFLDEAATRSLLEDGKWSHEAKGQLAAKAQKQLRNHHLSAANLKRAQMAAKSQTESLLKTMGFKVISVKNAE